MGNIRVPRATFLLKELDLEVRLGFEWVRKRRESISSRREMETQEEKSLSECGEVEATY